MICIVVTLANLHQESAHQRSCFCSWKMTTFLLKVVVLVVVDAELDQWALQNYCLILTTHTHCFPFTVVPFVTAVAGLLTAALCSGAANRARF